MKIDINKRNDIFNNKVNYVTHHAVTNINKPGKIRIVLMQEQSVKAHLSMKIFLKVLIC